jgi:hypothetical protein
VHGANLIALRRETGSLRIPYLNTWAKTEVNAGAT